MALGADGEQIVTELAFAGSGGAEVAAVIKADPSEHQGPSQVAE